MTKKARYILEKIALDFGTTRGLLQAFKAGGGKFIRTPKGSPSQYVQFAHATPGQIEIPKEIKNPRVSFYHEVGHFLDLRKATKKSIQHRDMLKAEQKANIIARRSIVNPQHKKLYTDEVNKAFDTYKIYAKNEGPHLVKAFKNLHGEALVAKYPILKTDAFGKVIKTLNKIKK